MEVLANLIFHISSHKYIHTYFSFPCSMKSPITRNKIIPSNGYRNMS